MPISTLLIMHDELQQCMVIFSKSACSINQKIRLYGNLEWINPSWAAAVMTMVSLFRDKPLGVGVRVLAILFGKNWLADFFRPESRQHTLWVLPGN